MQFSEHRLLKHLHLIITSLASLNQSGPAMSLHLSTSQGLPHHSISQPVRACHVTPSGQPVRACHVTPFLNQSGPATSLHLSTSQGLPHHSISQPVRACHVTPSLNQSGPAMSLHLLTSQGLPQYFAVFGATSILVGWLTAPLEGGGGGGGGEVLQYLSGVTSQNNPMSKRPKSKRPKSKRSIVKTSQVKTSQSQNVPESKPPNVSLWQICFIWFVNSPPRNKCNGSIYEWLVGWLVGLCCLMTHGLSKFAYFSLYISWLSCATLQKKYHNKKKLMSI